MTNIQVRGAGSLTASNGPLVVIDGIAGGDHFAVEHYRGIQIPEHGIAVGQIVDYQRSAAFRGFFIEFDGIVIVSGTVVGISLPAVVFECICCIHELSVIEVLHTLLVGCICIAAGEGRQHQQTAGKKSEYKTLSEDCGH